MANQSPPGGANHAEPLARLAGPSGHQAALFGERLDEVRAAISRAQAQAGTQRPIRLIAVSKLQPVEALSCARACGVVEFGENYAQEFNDKFNTLTQEPAFADVHWHFIGRLQRNKVK